MDSDWFYNILELDVGFYNIFYDIFDWDLKNTWTNLMDTDWFYYNQAGLLLEKYEKLLELSVKQLVIQSSLGHR